MALTSIRRRFPVLVKEINDEARKMLVLQAKIENQSVLTEQKSRIGYEPSWEGYGDNPGTAIDAAREKVVYHYHYFDEMVSVFLKALQDASPVDSGRYKRSHALYVNGQPAPPNTPVRPGMDFFIANPVVYARRLEVGKTTSGRDFLVSVPNRIYERTTKKLGARYANAAKVRMGYVTMPEAWTVQGKLPPRYRIMKGKHPYMEKRRQVVGSPVRAPAIFFEML